MRRKGVDSIVVDVAIGVEIAVSSSEIWRKIHWRFSGNRPVPRHPDRIFCFVIAFSLPCANPSVHSAFNNLETPDQMS